MIRRRREVASIESAVLVVREPRPQACGHIRGLEVLGISAWRVLGLGVEALLRQPLDDPERISCTLVKMHNKVFVVARPMTDRSAVLERWVIGCSCTAADPGGSGT